LNPIFSFHAHKAPGANRTARYPRLSPQWLVASLLFVFAVLPAEAQEPTSNDLADGRDQILAREFKKEVVRVTEGVYVAVGYGAANSALIVGDGGSIVVDTMYGTEAAEHVRSLFEEITETPIVAILHTHSHSDHIGGTAVFAGDGSPEIYARPPASQKLEASDEIAEILKRRGRRQFGSDLSDDDKIDGIAPVQRPKGGVGAGKLPPTRVVTADLEHLKIAGVDIELIAAPGETADHQLVWLPSQRVLMCGDNFYYSFPNLYAIRGTQYRDVSQWVRSLGLMIDLNAEHLISGHARPISGTSLVRQTLTDYRNAIEYVLLATLRGADQGLTPDELARSVQLPKDLAEKQYLQEYYGVIPWSVRSIYDGYLGWFDGNPTNLFPLSPTEEAKRMVRLAGSEGKLMEAAQTALADEDFQWACQLADYLLTLEPDSSDVRAIKAAALNALALQQQSSNARHYFLSSARELE
jgi:alkyl sulfatase BDS1-like metallo-beta-lactamase superfamily hydrolase